MADSSSTPPKPSTPLNAESASWLGSVATPPILLGLLAGRTVFDAVQQLGLASEELFRGDRLPALTVKESGNADTEA